MQLKKAPKKIVSCVLAFLCSVSMLASSVSAATATATDGINIRSGPGTSYSVIGVMGTGETAEVLDSSNSQWIKIRTSDGKEGYCSAQYIKLSGTDSTSSGSQSSTSSSATAVTTDALNLRSGPGSSYSVLKTLPKGQTVTVVDQSNPSWIKVKTSDGKEGYCSAQYLSIQTGSSTSGSSSQGSSSGSTQTSQTGTVSELLNMRSGPGKSYSVVEVLKKGSQVKVLGTDSATGWLHVQASSGNSGYCDPQYISLSGSSSAGESSNAGEIPQGVSGTLTLDTRSYTMAPGGIYDFRAKLEGTGLKQEDLKVSSSRTGIATVAQVPGTDKYRITAVGEGTCYVIAEIYGVHASIQVNVKKGVSPSGSSERSVSIIGGSSSSEGGNSGSTSGSSGSGSGSTSSQQPSQGISLNVQSYQFNKIGQTFLLTIYGVPYGSKPVVTVADPSVASVSDIGAISSNSYMVQIKSEGKGSSAVNVSLGGQTVSVAVTVSDSESSTGGVQIGGDGVIIGGGSSSSGGGSSSSGDVTGAQTTTAVNLRSGPGTNYTKLTTLPTGTYLTVIGSPDSDWIQVQTSSGQRGYVSAEYVRLLYNGDTGENYNNLSLSHTSGTVPVGKTLYIKANNAGTGSSLRWSSNNTSVATVSNGYIYAVSPGTAVITVSDASGTNTASCTVTVTQAEPVKAAYVSPNIASVGQTVELVAVTDNTRASVRFVLDTGETIDVTSYTEENGTESGLAPNYTRVWRAQAVFSTTGSHKVKVYSSTGSSMSTGYLETTSFVISTQDPTVSSTEERRASDEILSIMCQWEGYRGVVYIDQLAYGSIPTIGYGQTYSAGQSFYNNITKTEAWALLVNGVNGSYTTEVNKFIRNNNLKVNQQQFDAMISFSHNVGAGYWNGTSAFDIRTILLNAVVPPESIPAGGMAASTTSNAVMYSSPSFSASQITEIMNGASVTVLASSFTAANDGWYLVQAPNGTQGWVRAGYIRFADNAAMVHDLNYTDAHVLGSEWLAWHHAGGKCWAGLVYRRLGEAKIFSYGNYAEAKPGSSNQKHNTYGYEYPDCAKQFEQ